MAVDPRRVLDELIKAAQVLSGAATKLQQVTGNHPLAQALANAVASLTNPQGRVAQFVQNYLTSNYGQGSQPGQQYSGGGLFDVLKDMSKALLTKGRTWWNTSGNPSKKPPQGWLARHAAKTIASLTQTFGKTKLGRLFGGVANTAVGRGIGRLAKKLGGSIAARTGLTAFAGAGAAGGVAAAGATLVAGIGIVVGALTLVGTALYAFGKLVTAIGDEQLKDLRQYEKVSAGMAMVFAQADMRDTFRNMERGARLAPQAQLLSNADQKLKDNSTEIVVLLESIQSIVLAFLESGLADILEPLNEMAGGVIEWMKKNGLLAEGQAGEAFDQILDRVAKDGLKAMQAGDRWQDAARRDRR